MSERHVVLRAGRGDTFSPDGSAVVLTLDTQGDSPRTDIQQHHLWEGLARLELRPSQVAVDLYRICAAAYCTDLRLPRSQAYDGWTREIVLHVPVADRGLWSPQVETLTTLLGFLSGDKWGIDIREREVPAPEVAVRRKRTAENQEQQALGASCLFSGGLDSFIGAVDAAAAGRHLLLVSHLPEGIHRFLSPAQESLRSALFEAYADRRIEHLKVTLNPPPETKKTAKESTQRSRSILFLGLGTLAAIALGDGTPLIVPENGFISLNLPLTPGRIGSLSTRTTHPYAIDLYRRLLKGLALNVPLELPYMFMTKGEMLSGTTDPDVVHQLAKVTVSCANPNPYGPATEAHCGHCVPCIIRRSAFDSVGLDDPARYRLDIRAPGRQLSDAEASHLTGFRLAIRRRAGGVSTAELLAAGPLPSSIGAIEDFRGVHDRGLVEVASFLGETV